MLPADKTPEPVADAALYQRCFERERRARQQAEAVLEAKSLDLYLKHEELRRINATLEQRIQERTGELHAAVRQAEKASATKSEFLAKMSHEIRTPMNGVLGMLEALGITTLDDRQKEYLKVARNSAEALLALINDILDFSKIEAGRMSIENINFDLQQLLNSVMQLWLPRAQEKNLQLTLQIDPDVKRWLIGDPTRLGQILTNLVSNSLKFTHRGCINIQCDALTSEDMDPAMLRFTVQDTGIGMNEQVCKRLFNAFEQGEGAATSRVYGGTGLGLAICRQLAQLMDGEISVESTPGVGSCFILVLPFQIGTAAVEDPAVVMNTSHDANVKHHLLVVDDNETNRRVALAVLDHLGFATSFACDGIEAVEAVKHGNFSMVLMDCHMPNMDGFAATTAIREWEKLQGRPFMPIIAVSASAFQDDRNRCSSVGMNDFVAKPVTLNSLQAAVQRWLPATSITETTISAAHPLAISGDDEFPEQLLDRTQFMEMKMITANQFTTLLEKFCADSLLQVQGMRDAALNNNAEAMRKCSHKLKGSSGSIGAKVLSKVCHRMEERARSGNIDGVAEAVDAISVCLDEVIAAIKKLVSGNSSANPK